MYEWISIGINQGEKACHAEIESLFEVLVGS